MEPIEILTSFQKSLDKFQENVKEFFSKNLLQGYTEKITSDGLAFIYPNKNEFSIRWEGFYIPNEKGIFFFVDTEKKGPGKGIGTQHPFEKMDKTFFEHVNKIIDISEKHAEKIEKMVPGDEKHEARTKAFAEFSPVLNEFRAYLGKKSW